MKTAPFHILFILFCSLLLTPIVVSQETRDAPSAPEPSAENVAPSDEPSDVKVPIIAQPDYVVEEAAINDLGPKNKEFMQKYERYKEISKSLTALRHELPTAKAARQVEIDKEWDQLIQEGTSVFEQMKELCFGAFDEAPNRNPFVSNILCSVVEWEFQQDNYEEAVRYFRKLAQYGVPQEAKVILFFAGFSALMTMDLEEAEAWLKVAEEQGVIENVISAWAQNPKNEEKIISLRNLYDRIPVFKKDWAAEQAIRKAETEAGEADPAKKLPRVLLKTGKGDIVLELFENEAPNTVANFISLVEKGFYNDTAFHRVIPMFMAQGGDPNGNGSGGPGYAIDCENRRPDARKHFRGTLSMAHAGPNTGGSQFFLTFVPTYFLDRESRPPGHTVFGRVVEGMDVLAKIQRFDPSDEKAIIPEFDTIQEAKVLNKRDHEYKPETHPARRQALR